MVFSQLAGANTTPELQAIERDMAPVVTRHWNEIFLNAALFGRVDQLYRNRSSLGLDAESLRVLERYHLDFVRAGAQLTDAQRARYAEITERLSVLATEFAQNVLGDEQEAVFAFTEAEMDGLPADAARLGGRARARPQAQRAVCRLDLAFECRADPALRRGSCSAREGLARLRQPRSKRQRPRQPQDHRRDRHARTELTRLLGYATYAALQARRHHGQDAGRRAGLCWSRSGRPAYKRAEPGSRCAAGADCDEAGETYKLKQWDWPFYAEKLRREQL